MNAKAPRALLAGLVLLALTAVPAMADPIEWLECGGPTGDGCGEIVLTGADPGVLRLTLGTDTAIATPEGSSPDMTVTTEGDLAGFVLRGVGEGTTGRLAIGIYAPGVVDEQVVVARGAAIFRAPGFAWHGPTTEVPAGEYDLYLLTDGQPAEVRLRLQGLTGSTTVTPAVPADVRVPELTPVPVQAGDNVAGGYAYESLDTGAALVLQLLALDVRAQTAAQFAFCSDSPYNNVDNPFLLGPACAGIGGATYSERGPSGAERLPDELFPHTRLYVNGHLPTSSTTLEGLGYGYNYAAETVVDDHRALQVWVGFRG